MNPDARNAFDELVDKLQSGEVRKEDLAEHVDELVRGIEEARERDRIAKMRRELIAALRIDSTMQRDLDHEP